MNNYDVDEIIKDFSDACHKMSEAYQNRQNNKGNKERAKAVAYFKRFVMDKELFYNCIEQLLDSEDASTRDFSASICLALNCNVDKALAIERFYYNKKPADYFSVSALMSLSDWERDGRLEICEAKEINKIAGIPICISDIDSYVEYIKIQVGTYEKVNFEVTSKCLPVDVIVVPPSKGKDYYTLVTMGAFYYKMPVPNYYEKMNRAEYAIRLPADWEIDNLSKEWQWPIEVLRKIARLPWTEKSWLGWYHDVKFKSGFSKATKYTGVVLDVFDEESEPLTLDNGDQLILYNVIPIYQEELEYCMEVGGKELIEKMDDSIKYAPLNKNRESVV